MKRPPDLDEVLVTNREWRGENTVLVTCLCRGTGLGRLAKRVSVKRSSVIPDFFDSAQVVFDPQTRFIAEYRAVCRRTGIGRSPVALAAASRLARLINDNFGVVEWDPSLFPKIEAALDAFETVPLVAAAELKILFLINLREGLPVREDWLDRLGESSRARVSEVVSTPLAQLSRDRLQIDSEVTSLWSWMRRATDWIVHVT